METVVGMVAFLVPNVGENIADLIRADTEHTVAFLPAEGRAIRKMIGNEV